MKKYKIMRQIVVSEVLEVVADDLDDAISKAKDLPITNDGYVTGSELYEPEDGNWME